MSFAKSKITSKSQYIVFVLGILITLMTAKYTYDINAEKERIRFETDAKQILLLIQNRMDAYKQVLISGSSLFYLKDNVTRDDWKNFVASQKINSTFPGIQGIGFSKVIRANEKDAHIKALRAEGFANYDIKPEGQRDIYTSIIYLEPFNERNKRAFAYDMYTEKVRHAAMDMAIENAEPSLSGKVRLKQENTIDVQAGFLMYVPVYKKGALLNSKEDRVKAIEGFVYAPFRAKDLMNGVAGHRVDSVDVEIYDSNLQNDQSLIYDSNPQNDHSNSRQHFNATLNIAGHIWYVNFTSLKQFENETDKNNVLYILLGGFTLSILLYFLVNSLIKRKQNAIYLAKEITKKLATSEERLRYALEGAGDGLWDWNVQTGEMFCSKRFKEMLGYSADDEWNNIKEWEDRLCPEDTQIVYSKMHEYFAGKGSSYKNELRMRCKDGSYKWVMCRGVIVQRDADNKPLRMVGSHTDIHDKKGKERQISESESRLRLAAMTGELGIWEWDINTNVLIWDDKIYELHNVKKGDFKNNYDAWIATVVKEDIEATEIKIKECIDSVALYSAEYRVVNPDGSTKTIKASGDVIRDASGKAIKMVGAVMDITAQKNNEKHLQMLVENEISKRLEQERLLIRQSRLAAMGEMMGNIAHQWRQPLNQISTYKDALVEDYMFNELSPKKMEEFNQNVSRGLQYLSQTIDDFRNFFKPNKEKQLFDVKEVIKTTLSLINGSLKSALIVTTIDITDEDLKIFGYQSEFSHVLINILNNAKDALILNNTEDNRYIYIKATKQDGNVKIKISDNAKGIPTDILDKIFDPYFTTKHASQGTGLGLYMSKIIIEQNMHGGLVAYNTDDGACFEVELSIESI